jgi:hypothetical protein
MSLLSQKFWPPVNLSNFDFQSDSVYFGAVGFEDRSLNFLRELKRREKRLRTIFAIEYLPKKTRNRKREFITLANSVSEEVVHLQYDRFRPHFFSKQIDECAKSLSAKQLIVDISSLSKLAEISLLNSFAYSNIPMSVVYTEAETYHPTKRSFDKRRGRTIFRTSYVYSIISLPSPEGMAMQGSPLAMVVFPTFNQLELRTLLNEITPQELFILEGIQPYTESKWRLDAVRLLNKEILESTVQKESIYEKAVSTRFYSETIEALQGIYMTTRYTHRLLVAPTGSKMQALGVTLFRLMHPEIQIIYPVASDFFAYTEGSKETWQVDFGPFDNFTSRLEEFPP